MNSIAHTETQALSQSANAADLSPLQAVIFDWAGTLVDFGSLAPTQIFVEAFAEFDVQVSIEEARGPMGMGKWDHIRTLCNQPQVAERYRQAFGRTPTDDDVTAIYQRFMPLQIEKIGVTVMYGSRNFDSAVCTSLRHASGEEMRSRMYRCSTVPPV